MMKKFTTVVLAGCICLTGVHYGNLTNASAQSFAVIAESSKTLSEGDYKDIHWSVNADYQLVITPKSDGKTAEICDFFTMLENPDPMAQEHYTEIVEYQPWSDYSDKITSVFIENGITAVGAYTFHDMPKLNTVSMAESVERIGKKAFYALPLTNVKWSSKLNTIEESAFQGTHIKELILPDSLKTIGNSAFKNCTKLEQIVMSDSITKIGTNAFSGCSSLTELSLPDSLVSLAKGSFSNCSGLKSISFGNGIKEIPWLCFSGCTSLESVVIDKNIATIGTSAFADCSSLSYVSISDSVTEIKDGAFSKCSGLKKMIVLNPTLDLSAFNSISHTDYMIYGIANSTAQKYAETNEISFEKYESTENKEYPFADGLTWAIKDGVLIIKGKGEIPDYTFTGNSSTKDTPWKTFSSDISSIKIENGITRIGDKAFYNLANAVSVTIPDSLKSIGNNSFQKCGIVKLTIPESVTEIGNQAFRDCTKLTTVCFPSTLVSIPDNICGGCSSLTVVNISEGTKIIGDSAFSFCSALENIEFPDSLETLKAAAFINCSKLSKVSFGNQLKVIEGSAFEQCKALTSVNFGESITEIGDGAFCKTGLSGEVIIPKTVSVIGNSAFLDCPNIKSFRILAPKLTLDNRFYPLGYATGTNSYNAVPTTIYGYSGSKTQVYAYNENAFEFIALDWDFPEGDVNLDGQFNISDVVLLQKWLLNVPNTELKYWQAADLCADGHLDVFDLCMMKRKLLY